MASAIKASVTSALDPNFNASNIDVEKLNLPSRGEKSKVAFLLRNVFLKTECEALIRLSEDAGYQTAMVNVADGVAHVAPGYRTGHRVMIDDEEFAEILFQRIKTHMPQTFQPNVNESRNWNLVQINERLRFLRYGPNDLFKPHEDARYVRKLNKLETLFTLQIYLNEGFEGGETTFFPHGTSTGTRVPIKPETGMILVFQHNILHEGSVVKSGKKYTIRTDVLYELPPLQKKNWLLELFNI